MDLEKLKDEFLDQDLEWRVQQSGMSKTGKPWALVLCYVTARAVQDRLDEICGVENWCDKFEHQNDGVMCGISLNIDGKWVTKWDGSPETKIDAFKGGISKASVRCGSKWGVGRYLYKIPATFANFVDKKTEGAQRVQIKKNKNGQGLGETFFWLPPPMSVLRQKAKGSKKIQKKQPDIKSELQALVKKTKGWGGASVVRLMSELCDLEDPKLMTVENYNDLKYFISKYQPSDIDQIEEIKREQEQ